VRLDNQGFFGLEQISASITMALAGRRALHAPTWFGSTAPLVTHFVAAIRAPRPDWGWAFLSGTSFGMVAFFSVFIFMFKGRTATFAGLVNRLTSLVAGTTSTLVVWAFLGGKPPKGHDWGALALIFVAVYFLTRAEKRRAAELRA
jgi:drug/metabolite transporter (DMT)-like permease